MSRFKAGDLALIIRAYNPCNIGKTVELVFRSNDEAIFHGGFYIYNEDRASCWAVNGRLAVRSIFGGDVIYVDGSACPESWLMPLRGDFTPEEMREMEKDHA